MSNNQEPKPLTVKVMKGVCLAAAGRGPGFLRLLETFFLIKAIWVDRPMPNTPAAVQELATASKLSTKQIKRRLSGLEQIDFIRAFHGRGYDALNWKALAADFGIKHIHFYHIKNSEHVKLYHILDAKVDYEKQKECAVAIRNRVRSNPITQEVFQEVAGSRFYPGSLANHQLNYLLTRGMAYSNTEDADLVLSTRYRGHHSDKTKEKILRGDTALSSRTLSRIYNYSGHSAIAYKKRKWQRLGICAVTKRTEPISDGLYTSKAARKHRLGWIRYNNKISSLELVMPDLIEHLPLSSIDHRFERMQQLMQQQQQQEQLQHVQNLLRKYT